MKRTLAGLFFVALALSACSSGTPTTTVNGKLSANTRAEKAAATVQAAAKARRTTTTRRAPHTTRTSRPSPTTPSQPTTPTTPTTISQSGVAGVVLYETNCSADRPCSFTPGPAKVQLRNAKGDVVASTQASDHGAFVIPVAPGSYTLTATPPAKKQRCGSQSITVSAGQYATAQITCGAK